MKLPPDQQRVSVLLQDTVTLLCKNGLDYSHQFCVDGTIGITIDERNVFLVKLDQKIFKDANEKRERHTSNEGGGNRVRKRKTVVESEPGLFNGNHNDSTYSSLKSGSKMPRLQGSTGCLLDSHSVPTKKRSVDTKLTESIEHSDIENDTPPKDVSAVFPSTLLDDKDEQLERTSRHNDQNNTDSSSMTLVKQEPDSGGNNTDLAMQLLYPQSENATEGNNTTVKSDILNIEHQVTGPPVWPEPTLSLSAGLTLPTVIAPTNSTATVIDSGSPQAEEESSGHANSSQLRLPPLLHHLSPRKHCCKLCGRGFKEQWMVKRHMLTHSLPSFFCPHCDKPFKRKDTMRMHILKSHPDASVSSSSQKSQQKDQGSSRHQFLLSKYSLLSTEHDADTMKNDATDNTLNLWPFPSDGAQNCKDVDNDSNSSDSSGSSCQLVSSNVVTVGNPDDTCLDSLMLVNEPVGHFKVSSSAVDNDDSNLVMLPFYDDDPV